MSPLPVRDRRGRSGLETLVERINGLRRFIEVTERHVPEERLVRARDVVDRASERLALSRTHTVVALAGATGSGKSSIFNSLAGEELSSVGVRRPTTGQTHACVWGTDRAHELLDWLGVTRRYGRADDERLTGLVLLDLPDFDSVEQDHRLESDRLVGVADLIVWVLDPQKYADRVLHRRYLATFGHHRDITVVVLNQADRLTESETKACLTDLSGLLEADGLPGVPTIATSVVGAPGLGQLRAILEQTVSARLAALQRLSGDVAATVAELEPLVAAERRPQRDRAIASELHQALAGAAGVPLVAQATEQSYVHRAVQHTGWPLTRWLRRFRADPLARLRLGGGDRAPSGATSIGPAAPAASAALSLALRTVADRYANDLPPPWPAAALAAARSRVDDLPDALDQAIARTNLGMARTPRWWRIAAAAQWLLALVAAAGLGWLVVRYAMFALALPEPPMPQVGRVPVSTLLFAGGLLGGIVLAAVLRRVVAVAARRRRRRITDRLTGAVRRVGDELVLGPLARVGQEYDEARAALAIAKR